MGLFDVVETPRLSEEGLQEGGTRVAGPLCCSLAVPFNHERGDVAAHAVAALTTAMSDMLRRKRADLAAAQQIFIKAQLVAGESGCQSCVMQ